MFRYPLSWYIFAFTLLESFIKTHLTLHDSSHGFINKNQRYFEEDFNNIHDEITSGFLPPRLTDVSPNMHLKFEPSFLDFKQRPLGVPHSERVTLINTDKNKTIDMTSISGSTVHFHSSFFEDKKIPPNGNTSFNVVFLGREEGLVESNLFIHTSEGYFKYNVKGATTFSRYRLRPIVGIKLPVNSSFSPLIYMHNPHPEPIQIVEIYSSGGDFHLELPSGEQEGPNDMWEIPPLETKAIIRVRFLAKTVQNHTAYVRIKLNRSEDEVLVVPLEVEVTYSGELFHPQGSVDFGVGGSLDIPKQVKLCIENPLKKPVRIHSITTTSKAIEINFDNVKIAAEDDRRNKGCTEVATLTLNWKTAFEEQDYNGKILVKFRNGRNVSEIPYYLTVLQGGVSFDKLIGSYYVNENSDFSSRGLKLKNDFLNPIKILNYSLEEQARLFFTVESFNAAVLRPQQEKSVLKIKPKPGINLLDQKIDSSLWIKTNVSDVKVPIVNYNGKLEIHLPFKSKDYSLDLGLISLDSKKDVFFLIVNQNPVPLNVKTVRSSIPMTYTELFGCGVDDDYQLALFQVNFKNLTKCTTLKPGKYAIIKLSVQTSNAEGQIWGDVQIETQYEHLSIPVHFKVAPGKLEIGPDRLVFDQCFPGKICSHPLRVHSTFKDPMNVEDIISLPPDRRIFSKHTGQIQPKTTKVIGYLYLNPNIECGNECYTGFLQESTVQWLKTFSLQKYVADFDLNLVNLFYARYLNLTSNGLKKWQNLTMRLDTSEVRGHIFKTRVKMSWPSLVSDQHIDNKSAFAFPLTQIGNVSYRNLNVRNPCGYNLVVQLVFEKDYPNADLLYEDLPRNFVPGNLDDYITKEGFFFHTSTKKQFEHLDIVDMDVHESSVAFLLKPGQNITVTLGFKSQDSSSSSTLLFIRNNLTVLEIVQLKGQGAFPQFKFGNRKPGSTQPLTFEITEKHLKDCEPGVVPNSNPFPNLTVKRSFTARNIGDVPIKIHSFHINDFSCEGYGFKVINCVPFVLPPNGTRKIDIAFTPDLTLAKVSRTLILGTSLNFPVNYTLYTTIPPNYLSLCSNLIMRPHWEIYLSSIAIGLMLFMFVIIITLAVWDADRIKRESVSVFLSPRPAVQPVLDLRLIGEHAREEIRTSKVEKVVNGGAVGEEIKVVENKLIEKVDKAVGEPIEEEKVKEPEKYSALIPSCAKNKKKLAKRNSNEGEEVQKRPERYHGKQKEILKEEKKIEKEKKKAMLSKKNSNAKNYVPVYEEETSSTTTESSNNEDPEKENDQRNKSCLRKFSGKGENAKSDEIVKQAHGVQSGAVKLEKQKKEKVQKVKEQEVKIEQNLKQREQKKAQKPQKERKEKVGFIKSSVKNKESNARKSPIAPPVTSGKPVWGENGAKFSDVVARTEILSTTRPLAQTNHAKPTMFVEPYKQSAELGPIGSKKVDAFAEALHHASQESSNSFFSNNQDIRINNGTTLFDDIMSTDTWSQHHQNYINLLDSATHGESQLGPTNNEDPWNQSNSYTYWNNSLSPLLPETITSLASSIQQSNSAQQSSYLWGSSSVWQPLSVPEMPTRTPTRTPPGFDEPPLQRRLGVGVEIQHPHSPLRDSYSPFNSNTSVWSQDPRDQWAFNRTD